MVEILLQSIEISLQHSIDVREKLFQALEMTGWKIVIFHFGAKHTRDFWRPTLN